MRRREESREVDERENVTGNVRAVARLELRLSRNEGWRRMRIGMVQLGRTRGKRGTGRECQKTRRPFSVDGWNRTSPMASISVDALCPRYNDDVPRRALFVATDGIVWTTDIAANDARVGTSSFSRWDKCRPTPLPPRENHIHKCYLRQRDLHDCWRASRLNENDSRWYAHLIALLCTRMPDDNTESRVQV